MADEGRFRSDAGRSCMSGAHEGGGGPGGFLRSGALHRLVCSRSLSVWPVTGRSEEHTSELQSLMRISYAVFCLKKKITQTRDTNTIIMDQLLFQLHLEKSQNQPHTDIRYVITRRA